MCPKCCSTDLTNMCLRIYQLLFLIIGFVIIAMAVYVFDQTYDSINILDSPIYSTTIYIFMANGCLVIFTFFLGCYAIPKDKTKLIFCYILLLVIGFLLGGLTGILSYIYQDNIEEEMHINLESNILSTYKRIDDKTKSIDRIQQTLKCCGSDSFMNWKNSTWMRNENISNLVPDSCCKSVIFECGQRDHPSNIFYRGCSSPLIDLIKYYLRQICAASLALSIYELLGIVLGMILFLQLEKNKFQVKRTPEKNGCDNLLKDDSAYS